LCEFHASMSERQLTVYSASRVGRRQYEDVARGKIRKCKRNFSFIASLISLQILRIVLFVRRKHDAGERRHRLLRTLGNSSRITINYSPMDSMALLNTELERRIGGEMAICGEYS